MIITLSPAQTDYDETMSSLEYGHRAQNIKNNPEVTESKNLTRHVGHLKEEIQKLQRQLDLQSQKTGGVMITLERKEELECKAEAYEQLFEMKEELESENVELREKQEQDQKMLEEAKSQLAEYEREINLLRFISDGAIKSSQNQFDQASMYKRSGESLLSSLATAKEHLVLYDKTCNWNDMQSADALKALSLCAETLETLISEAENETTQSATTLAEYKSSQESHIERLTEANHNFTKTFETCIEQLKQQNEEASKEASQFVELQNIQAEQHRRELEASQLASHEKIQRLTSEIGQNLSSISASHKDYYTKHSSMIENRLAQILSDSTLEGDFHRNNFNLTKSYLDEFNAKSNDFMKRNSEALNSVTKSHEEHLECQNSTITVFSEQARARRQAYEENKEQRDQEFCSTYSTIENAWADQSKQFVNKFQDNMVTMEQKMNERLQEFAKTMASAHEQENAKLREQMMSFIQSEVEKSTTIRNHTAQYRGAGDSAETSYSTAARASRTELFSTISTQSSREYDRIVKSASEISTSTKSYSEQAAARGVKLQESQSVSAAQKMTSFEASKVAREQSVEEAKQSCTDYVEKLKERVATLGKNTSDVTQEVGDYSEKFSTELETAHNNRSKTSQAFTTAFKKIQTASTTTRDDLGSAQAASATSFSKKLNEQTASLKTCTTALEKRLRALKKISSKQLEGKAEVLTEVEEFKTIRKANPELRVEEHEPSRKAFKVEVLVGQTFEGLVQRHSDEAEARLEEERLAMEESEEQQKLEDEEKENNGFLDDEQFNVPMVEGNYFDNNPSKSVSAASKRKKFKKPVLTASLSNEQIDTDATSITSSEISPRTKKGRVAKGSVGSDVQV